MVCQWYRDTTLLMGNVGPQTSQMEGMRSNLPKHAKFKPSVLRIHVYLPDDQDRHHTRFSRREQSNRAFLKRSKAGMCHTGALFYIEAGFETRTTAFVKRLRNTLFGHMAWWLAKKLNGNRSNPSNSLILTG